MPAQYILSGNDIPLQKRVLAPRDSRRWALIRNAGPDSVALAPGHPAGDSLQPFNGIILESGATLNLGDREMCSISEEEWYAVPIPPNPGPGAGDATVYVWES